jgi:DNA-binding NarL/FixJ family response regulator
MKEDSQLQLKKGEILNSELRVLALIRLGIDSSNKIASFLHYSPQTIYNYRVKMKNSSRFVREDFEQQIKNMLEVQ